jgi:hypothetical protein
MATNQLVPLAADILANKKYSLHAYNHRALEDISVGSEFTGEA